MNERNDDRLDEILDALRGEATASERGHEIRDVTAMYSAHVANGATVTSARSRFARPLRAASLVAAGVIGFGGVAAAGPGVFRSLDENELVTAYEEQVVEQSEPESDGPSPTSIPGSIPDSDSGGDEPARDDDEIDAGDETGDDVEVHDQNDDDETVDPDTDPTRDGVDVPTEVECAEGNHGKPVSSVARSEDRTSDAVRTAARSSCGKDLDGDDDPEAAGDALDVATEVECAEGNHGKTVSSVARSEDRTSDAVRTAARSSCGKDLDGDDADDADVDHVEDGGPETDDPGDDDGPDDGTEDDVVVDEAGDGITTESERTGNGNGNGHRGGNGHGNGKVTGGAGDPPSEPAQSPADPAAGSSSDGTGGGTGNGNGGGTGNSNGNGNGKGKGNGSGKPGRD